MRNVTNAIAFDKSTGELVDMIQFEGHLSESEVWKNLEDYNGAWAFKDGQHNVTITQEERVY